MIHYANETLAQLVPLDNLGILSTSFVIVKYILLVMRIIPLQGRCTVNFFVGRM